jgi:hypothetical protein
MKSKNYAYFPLTLDAMGTVFTAVGIFLAG